MLNALIDFGGTNIKMALVNNHQMIHKLSIPSLSEEGIKPKLVEVKQCIQEMLQSEGYSLSDLNAVGIATPGIVDSINNRVISINDKFTDVVDFDFTKWCEEEFSCMLVMDNDANCALLGEVYFGCAKNQTEAVMLTIGTGLGTAAMMDGKLLRGKNFRAGILGGHLVIDINGKQCTCGGVGCAETLGGSKELGLFAPYLEGFSDSKLASENQINMEVLINLKKSNDKFCESLFDKMINIYAVTIVNIVHAYDPECVILSGGVMKGEEDILPPLIEKVNAQVWPRSKKLAFVVAENPDFSVIFGLEAMIMEKQK